MPTIAIINGPNLNLLGIREPNIYGSVSFDEYWIRLKMDFPNHSILYFQSNIEGELIDYIHQCFKNNVKGIILNAGSYTHTSVALADAISAVGIDTIEVHISNVFAREDFRKTSFIAAKCIGSISGLGLDSYKLALSYFDQKLSE